MAAGSLKLGPDGAIQLNGPPTSLTSRSRSENEILVTDANLSTSPIETGDVCSNKTDLVYTDTCVNDCCAVSAGIKTSCAGKAMSVSTRTRFAPVEPAVKYMLYAFSRSV
jgi:hypothetical protein